MRVLLIGIVALVVGVGGGAFVSGTKVKEALLAQAEQAAADSVAALLQAAMDEPDDGHGPTSDPGVDPLGPDGHAAADDSTGSGGGDAIDQAVAEALERSREQERVADSIAAAEAAAAEAAAEAARLAQEGARKLAKIFGAMQAPDAAAVLQEMSDEEVEMILMEMSDRLAAQILGSFDPARAAALTRAVLGSPRRGS